MAPSSIRKAVGAVKDRTSISFAKMGSNLDPELDILIVKATNHDTQIPKIRYSNGILRKTSTSRDLVKECVCLISKRIEKTHDWIVALKCLVLVHRLIVDGGRSFVKEIACANASGRMLSNVSVFRDEAHSGSWDYTEFVRNFGMYLVKKVELKVFDEMWLRKRVSSLEYLRVLDERGRKVEDTHLRDELVLEKVLSRMERLQRLLQRVLNVRSRCFNGKYRELLFLAVTPVIRDSFELYNDICGGLSFFSDCFWEMDYLNVVKTYGTYATVAKQFDDLSEFYAWCKDVGFTELSDEYPVVESISDVELRLMEEFVKKKANENKCCKLRLLEVSESVGKRLENNADGVKGYEQDHNTIAKDAVIFNVRSDVPSTEEKGENIALSLVHEDQNFISINPWEEFSDNAVQPHTDSVWQTPAAKSQNADWQMVLVDSESTFPKPRVDFGDSFDAFMLNDMYDQGASSLALPWHEETKNVVLALPSTEGSVQTVNPDPFTASLAVPPPPYVQMVELEKNIHLLHREQKSWLEYESNGRQGQVSLVLSGSTGNAAVPQERMPHMTSSNDLGLL